MRDNLRHKKEPLWRGHCCSGLYPLCKHPLFYVRLMDLWQDSELLKGERGIVVKIGRQAYVLTSLISEEYDSGLSEYMGTYEGARVRGSDSDSGEDTADEPLNDAIVKIRLQMDPVHELSDSVHYGTGGHSPKQDRHHLCEDSCAVLLSPTGKWLLDLQLQPGRILSKMILFVPFALDMASSYVFVLKEYLRYVAAASPISYKTDTWSWPRSRQSKLAD